MRRVGLLRGASLCALVGLLAALLSGCSSTTPSSSAVTVTGSTLDVYASQPAGPVDTVTGDVLDAEQLALTQAGGKAGAYSVKLIALHGREISANARRAVQDKKAIAYLGEIAPGTSGVSVQITNQVGLLEVSPSDTAVYLTQKTPAVSGAPGSYYPANGTFHRTFARVVATTVHEATALVSAMQARHLTKLYVTSDGQPYGASIAAEVRQDAAAHGLSIAASATGADAVFYGGMPGAAATQALDRAAAASPSATLFAPSALFDDTFVAGLSAAAQKNLYVTAPGFLTANMTAGQKAFASQFQAAYGHAPQPQAIYGYEAMSALLAVLKEAGASADSRQVVVDDFRALKNRQSPVLGTYSIDSGDSDLASFVLAHPAGGRLVPGSQP